MMASLGIDLSHTTLGGFASESSNCSFWTTGDVGGVPPVASATAKSTAVRLIQFCDVTVIIGKPLVGSCDAHAKALESSAATTPTLRFACWKAGSELANAAPKSVAQPSIWEYLARSAVMTCCVTAGSQLVTSNGCWPISLILVGSSTSWRHCERVVLCELPAGPPR